MIVNGTHYRTIWPNPDDRGSIEIIDQRQLPHRFATVSLRRAADCHAAIRDMLVRGAGLIGATAAYGMYLAVREASSGRVQEDIKGASELLKSARPTARNLAWAADRVAAAVADCEDLSTAEEKAFAAANLIADEDARFCNLIGEHGKGLIKAISEKKGGRPVNILTHCNAGWLAFVDYGSATAPIYAARDDGIALHVWVDETRPWNQGAKLTSWELLQEGIDHSLITDNAGGHLMQNGEVDMVIVGTDRATYTGDVANKIGTYLKALAAHDNDIPFYVALPSSTFDWQLSRGSDIPIEIRSGDEITTITGVTKNGTMETISIAPVGTIAVNYSFDVTPARLVTALITERGIVAATEAAIGRMFPDKAGLKRGTAREESS
ncbi:MAG: S-methyl-5-thioribose-1-phosphate isomerase [Desulfofustis sp.]|jgi:methylthioribose-1-phosphate isomerase|nr:S-methyl-5-thioribose-1-phosphate isomerase [Desulfofustis sp.]